MITSIYEQAHGNINLYMYVYICTATITLMGGIKNTLIYKSHYEEIEILKGHFFPASDSKSYEVSWGHHFQVPGQSWVV